MASVALVAQLKPKKKKASAATLRIKKASVATLRTKKANVAMLKTKKLNVAMQKQKLKTKVANVAQENVVLNK